MMLTVAGEEANVLDTSHTDTPRLSPSHDLPVSINTYELWSGLISGHIRVHRHISVASQATCSCCRRTILHGPADHKSSLLETHVLSLTVFYLCFLVYNSLARFWQSRPCQLLQRCGQPC